MTREQLEKMVKESQKELEEKSYREIQEETAWKWASRAAASYKNVEGSNSSSKFENFLLAQEYEHEAIEHAALISDPDTNLVREVQEWLEQYQLDAWHELQLSVFL